MYISDIIEFSKADREADVCVSDGRYSIMGYLFPADRVRVKQGVTAVLTLDCSNIVKEDKPLIRIEKLQQHYAYSITAQVLSQQAGTVQIGGICIQLDTSIPKDIMDMDYVSFSVLRLDVVL